MTYEKEIKTYELMCVAKKLNNINIKNQRKLLHKEFIKKHQTWMRVLDIMVVIFIILNFGAVFMTNLLVVKNNNSIVFKEANNIQAELNNYETHDKANDLMRAVFIQTLLWLILILALLSLRMRIITYNYLWLYTIIILFYAIALTLDFVNDLGYFVGWFLWAI